ncbi:hypothetical protein C8Q76DRAFT_361143 [Earliella scabrosa]|nr:hypothetical protein C8Q76DRAFT_361143 [Earliella scabrosa]
MKAFFAVIATAIAAAPFVAADFIPSGSPAHFFSTQNSALVFAPEGGFPGAGLVAARPGDGSSADITALYATQGTGVPGQIVYGDFCLTSEGVVPGTATQTLYFAECSDSPAQVWTVNESGTVSNADGNCVTLGRAAVNVPVTLAACTEELAHLQGWNPVPISA